MPLSATKAADKLPHSAVAAVVPPELVRLTCVVIRSWVDAWKDVPECRNFLRRRRFIEEVEESLVAIKEVISCLDSAAGTGSSFCRDSPRSLLVTEDNEASGPWGRLVADAQCSSLSTSADRVNDRSETDCPKEKTEAWPVKLPDSSGGSRENESDGPADELLGVEDRQCPQQQHSRGKLVVYDLCSGKGFFSLLLSSLAPLLPVLAAAVSEIVMVDKNSDTRNPIGLAHVEAANRIPDCLPIRFIQANLHDKQLPWRLGMQSATRCMFVGIHLCQRLSSRCVHLFRAMAEVECLVLSPCCVPMNGETVRLQGLSVDPSSLASAEDPYRAWVDFLLSAMGGQQNHDAAAPPAGGNAAAAAAGGGAGDDGAGGFCPPALIKAPLAGGEHRRNIFLIGKRLRTETGQQLEALRLGGDNQSPEPGALLMRMPDPEVECTQFWYRGQCRHSSCRFEHVRGSYLLGAHI